LPRANDVPGRSGHFLPDTTYLSGVAWEKSAENLVSGTLTLEPEMPAMNVDALLDQVRFGAEGLVTAVVQDHRTNEVLMVAYMNAATLRQTLETSRMTYWSRSRQQVWVKGETSGHTQAVKEVRLDCDGDALVFKVLQHGGAACHTGYRSCFYRLLGSEGLTPSGVRVFDPETVYGSSGEETA
jgi:phosphoribosyl-AMP cyclohydrolase